MTSNENVVHFPLSNGAADAFKIDGKWHAAREFTSHWTNLTLEQSQAYGSATPEAALNSMLEAEDAEMEQREKWRGDAITLRNTIEELKPVVGTMEWIADYQRAVEALHSEVVEKRTLSRRAETLAHLVEVLEACEQNMKDLSEKRACLMANLDDREIPRKRVADHFGLDIADVKKW